MLKAREIHITVLLLLINGRSVVLAARIQVIFTIGKVIALCIIIVGGLAKLAEGKMKFVKSENN